MDMKKITLAQEYLNLKADANDKLADTLEQFAGLIPNHKRITSRIITGVMELPERDYNAEYVPRVEPWATISNYYGRQFKVHYPTVEMNYSEIKRDQWESESFDIEYSFNYVMHEYTPAELKQQMTDRAELRRKEAEQYRAGVKSLESRVRDYEEKRDAFNASVEALSYTERHALGIDGKKIY